MNINFELYKVFYFCAKFSNFSKAAEKLYVTQSSVSQSIKKLEKETETKLFYRAGKSIKLSNEGEILFKYIENAYNTIKAAEKNLKNLKNLENGEVLIGASDTISKHYLMSYIKDFYSNYPNIKIKLFNNSSPETIRLVKEHNVDFGIININPHKNYKDINVKALWESENIFVYSKEYFHIENDEINIEVLNNYPILSLEKNSTTRQILDNYLEQHNIELDFDFEVGTTSLIIEMALAGVGIGYISKDAVKDFLNKKMLSTINIVENIPKIKIGLVINKEFPLTLTSQRFIELFE